ncbi:MAG: GH25 family lysozyme [Rhodobacterales bacterium]|nr:GH25 family lysozyme [Rhodobacterales bacterium]
MGWRGGLWLAFVAVLGLTACGDAPRDAEQSAATAANVSVKRANFGDADPFDWPGRGPSSYLVQGIDLSRWQSDGDWTAAREAGVNFAFIKATEGGDRVDPLFRSHMLAAEAAGVPWGAYHFFYFCTPAALQAKWFIDNVPNHRGSLPPVLDVEWNPQSPTCRTRPAPEKVRSEMAIFMRMVERHYGQRPIVYTNIEFWEDNGFDQITDEEFWLRSTAGHPSETYPGAQWVFWQYSGTGRVPGIGGNVDLNVFAGSAASWRAWLGRRMQ